MEIWERGAGYTLSSGTSSCAAAAVACRLGLCDKQITAHMPGGDIYIQFDDHWGVTMEGSVSKVFEATLAPEFCKDISI
jgi:diaminopimelate epimerase